jgi:hypothetical protein
VQDRGVIGGEKMSNGRGQVFYVGAIERGYRIVYYGTKPGAEKLTGCNKSQVPILQDRI